MEDPTLARGRRGVSAPFSSTNRGGFQGYRCRSLRLGFVRVLKGKWLDRVNIEVAATQGVQMRAETNS